MEFLEGEVKDIHTLDIERQVLSCVSLLASILVILSCLLLPPVSLVSEQNHFKTIHASCHLTILNKCSLTYAAT